MSGTIIFKILFDFINFIAYSLTWSYPDPDPDHVDILGVIFCAPGN